MNKCTRPKVYRQWKWQMNGRQSCKASTFVFDHYDSLIIIQPWPPALANLNIDCKSCMSIKYNTAQRLFCADECLLQTVHCASMWIAEAELQSSATRHLSQTMSQANAAQDCKLVQSPCSSQSCKPCNVALRSKIHQHQCLNVAYVIPALFQILLQRSFWVTAFGKLSKQHQRLTKDLPAQQVAVSLCSSAAAACPGPGHHSHVW